MRIKMKRLIFIFCVFANTVWAQSDSITVDELNTLYIRTIESFDYPKNLNTDQYFEVTANTERIKDRISQPHFKFLTDHELIHKAIKEHGAITANRVVHKIISKDTVDINLGSIEVTANRGIFFRYGLHFRKANFALACGGTEGYIPTARFVRNVASNEWSKIKFIKPKTYREKLFEQKQKQSEN